MNRLTKKQMYQEDEYNFPYHYLDLKEGIYKLINIDYLSNLEIIKRLIKPFNGQLILDAGCGDGRFSYELKKKNIKIVGVDFSESAIMFAKAFNQNVEFFVQDLEYLHLPYQFDYVVLIEVIEHLVPEKIPIILQNISKVLKKNGKLIIATPSIKLNLPRKHYQHFSVETLTKTLEQYFKIISTFGYSGIGYKRSIFINLRRAGYLLFPLRNRIKFVEKFFIFLNNYYKKNLALGNPNNSLGLIAICKKEEQRARKKF